VRGSILAGRLTGLASDEPGQVALITESAAVGDLGQGCFGGGKLAERFIDAERPKVFTHRTAESIGKDPGDMVGVNTHLEGQRIETDRSAEPVVEVLADGTQPLRCAGGGSITAVSPVQPRERLERESFQNGRRHVIGAFHLLDHPPSQRGHHRVAAVIDALDDRATGAELLRGVGLELDDEMLRGGGEPSIDVALAGRLRENGFGRAVTAP
jgi:hypothetical protein